VLFSHGALHLGFVLRHLFFPTCLDQEDIGWIRVCSPGAIKEYSRGVYAAGLVLADGELDPPFADDVADGAACATCVMATNVCSCVG
jgi:hypothetical protein